MFKFGIGFLCFNLGVFVLIALIIAIYSLIVDYLRKNDDIESEEFKRCKNCLNCNYCDKKTNIVSCSISKKEHFCPSDCKKFQLIKNENNDIFDDFKDM